MKFLSAMHALFSNLINKVLTDNGAQFTRYKGGKEGHIFTQTCAALGIITYVDANLITHRQMGSMNRIIKEGTLDFFYYATHSILGEHL